MKRLGDVMRAARAHFFVGRQAELALFREAVTADTLPFHVLHLWGPGGVGKTALTLAFREVCDEVGVGYYRLDGRDVGTSPEAFEQAVTRVLSPNGSGDGQPRSLDDVAEAGRFVLVVDSYEDLTALDRWLCEAFLPHLPADALLVLAGRYERSAMWRSRLGLPDLVHTLPLRNLTEAESRAYLGERGLPPEHYDDVLAFAHGYPLALSLVADAYDQDPATAAPLAASSDVVGTLLTRFLDGTLTPQQRRAVEATALARYVTQPLLAAVLSVDARADAAPGTHRAALDVAALFGWLRDLSFVEADASGLRMHELAREVLTADLRWRDPERYAALEATLRQHYTERLTQAHAGAFTHVLVDYLFLVRENPIVKPFYDELLTQWHRSDRPTSAATTSDDHAVLREGVARHEGEASAAAFAAWVRHHPDGLCVFRDGQGRAIGLLYTVPLRPDDDPAALPDDLVDPGVDAARAFLRQHAPLRPGECGVLFRWWLSLEDYQAVSLVQGTIFVETVKQYMRTPGLAYSLLPCADAATWAPVFGYADLAREEAATFTLSRPAHADRTYGVFGHDWRVRPPATWLDLMAERGSAFRPAPAAPAQRSDLVVLSEEGFTEALKDALLHFTQPDRLRANPLLRSRLVHDPSHSKDAHRIEALRKVVREAVAILERGPREAKFARALEATYLDPAPTQERAAERLDLAFSTYRRHLRQGLDALTHALWQREVRG